MLVIDASVAVEFVSNEAGRAEALSICGDFVELIAPDWIRIEVAHSLWRKVGMQLLSREQATNSSEMLARFFDVFHPAIGLLTNSQELAFELQHGVYDCLYLALAVQRNCNLLTADRKF